MLFADFILLLFVLHVVDARTDRIEEAFDDDEDDFASWSRCPFIKNKLKNGRVKIRSRGRIAKFMCDPGFELAGKRFATCVRGQWNNPIPVCVSRGCFRPPAVANARVSEMYRGAVLLYDCLPGYTVIGGATVYCDGLHWSSDAPTCEVAVTDPQLYCDFENPNLCGWSHDPTHDFDWKRNQFATPSGHVGTGPTFDHTFGPGKGGFYLYMEASSPRKVNDTARLFSPVYSKEHSGGCFVFWYHMFGSTTGGLRVYIKPESHVFGEFSPKWSLFGDQGNRWFRGNVSVPQFTENFQIVIEGIRGSSYIGDSAIDDVSLTTEDCSLIGNSTEHVTEYASNSCRGRCREVNDSYPCGCDESCLTSEVPCCGDFQEICTKNSESEGTAHPEETYAYLTSASPTKEETSPKLETVHGTIEGTTLSMNISTVTPAFESTSKFSDAYPVTNFSTVSGSIQTATLPLKSTTSPSKTSLFPTTYSSTHVLSSIAPPTTTSIVTSSTPTTLRASLVPSSIASTTSYISSTIPQTSTITSTIVPTVKSATTAKVSTAAPIKTITPYTSTSNIPTESTLKLSTIPAIVPSKATTTEFKSPSPDFATTKVINEMFTTQLPSTTTNQVMKSTVFYTSLTIPSTSINPYTSTSIKPYTSTSIKPYTSTSINPYTTNVAAYNASTSTKTKPATVIYTAKTTLLTEKPRQTTNVVTTPIPSYPKTSTRSSVRYTTSTTITPLKTEATRRTYNLRPRIRTTTPYVFRYPTTKSTTRTYFIRTSTRTPSTTSSTTSLKPTTSKPATTSSTTNSPYTSSSKTTSAGISTTSTAKTMVVTISSPSSTEKLLSISATAHDSRPAVTIVSVFLVIVAGFAVASVFYIKRWKRTRQSKLADDSEMRYLYEQEASEFSDFSAVDKVNFRQPLI